MFAGTKNYMAPEFHKNPSDLKYSGKAVDVFAAGVALFTIKSAHPPFLKATKADNWYKFISAASSKPMKRERYLAAFWKIHEKNHEPGFYSEEFKRVFEAMVHPESAGRATIDELIESDWMQDDVSTE